LTLYLKVYLDLHFEEIISIGNTLVSLVEVIFSETVDDKFVVNVVSCDSVIVVVESIVILSVLVLVSVVVSKNEVVESFWLFAVVIILSLVSNCDVVDVNNVIDWEKMDGNNNMMNTICKWFQSVFLIDSLFITYHKMMSLLTGDRSIEKENKYVYPSIYDDIYIHVLIFFTYFVSFFEEKNYSSLKNESQYIIGEMKKITREIFFLLNYQVKKKKVYIVVSICMMKVVEIYCTYSVVMIIIIGRTYEKKTKRKSIDSLIFFLSSMRHVNDTINDMTALVMLKTVKSAIIH
jgi:hypothetical protein